MELWPVLYYEDVVFSVKLYSLYLQAQQMACNFFTQYIMILEQYKTKQTNALLSLIPAPWLLLKLFSWHSKSWRNKAMEMISFKRYCPKRILQVRPRMPFSMLPIYSGWNNRVAIVYTCVHFSLCRMASTENKQCKMHVRSCMLSQKTLAWAAGFVLYK